MPSWRWRCPRTRITRRRGSVSTRGTSSPAESAPAATNAIERPSGDQASSETSVAWLVRGSGFELPSAAASQTCRLPNRSDRYASREPSGDHAGEPSFAPPLATVLRRRGSFGSRTRIRRRRTLRGSSAVSSTTAACRPSGDSAGSKIRTMPGRSSSVSGRRRSSPVRPPRPEGPVNRPPPPLRSRPGSRAAAPPSRPRSGRACRSLRRTHRPSGC